MLLLLFEAQTGRYALDAHQVVEVLPLVTLQPVPHAPRGVAGVFNYRGTPLPVMDLSDLMIARPAVARLSTRIIVVRYPLETDDPALIGLIAEHATDTIRRSSDDFVSSGITNDAAPYAGPVATDRDGMVQLIQVTALLTPAIREMLFTGPRETHDT